MFEARSFKTPKSCDNEVLDVDKTRNVIWAFEVFASTAPEAMIGS
jgi:hypothetical protein